MARKVIIDCDPGIDDAVALCLALFDPRLEVLAITATAGSVSAAQASRNVQAIVEQLDPPRLPRLGAARPVERAPARHGPNLNGDDGLGNAGFDVSQLHHQHPSDKMICDTVRSAPGEVTIIALGPLTNIARAFQRDPSLPSEVDRIVLRGGSLAGIGDVTPAAEFNMYYDPHSARTVFRSRTTKTLVPLDVTRQVRFSMNLIDELPDASTNAGAVLRAIVPFAFRAYHQQLGLEGIHLHDAVALVATIHPELFETVELDGDVETVGELTTGATIFDRRPHAERRSNLEVANVVDAAAVQDSILRGLGQAGKRS